MYVAATLRLMKKVSTGARKLSWSKDLLDTHAHGRVRAESNFIVTLLAARFIEENQK
jgi:hypothetical protein